jgi:hypothetical protein
MGNTGSFTKSFPLGDPFLFCGSGTAREVIRKFDNVAVKTRHRKSTTKKEDESSPKFVSHSSFQSVTLAPGQSENREKITRFR